MKFILKIILLISLFVTFNSCANRILITTTPTEVEINVGDSTYISPTRIKILPESIIKLSKDGYHDKTLSGTQLLSAENRKINIELHIKYYKIILDRDSTRNLSIFNGEIELEKPYIVPMGQYTLIFSKEGYFSENVDLNLDQDSNLKVILLEKYDFINIPEDIKVLKINDEVYKIDQSFPLIESPRNKPIIIDFLKENESFLIGITKSDFYRNEIDLQTLLNRTVFIDPIDINNGIKIEASWIKQVENPIALRHLEMVAIGFESNFQGERKINHIVRNPQYYLPNVSIINPTNNIIGSTVIVEMNTEKREYYISEEFYENKLKYVYTTSYTNGREINSKQEYLSIDTYNFNVPFNNSTISVKLEKNNEIIDEALLTSGKGKNIFGVYGHYDYHLYNKPRTSFFYDNSFSDSFEKYLYIDSKLSNQFLIVYKKQPGNREYIPIGIYEIEAIALEPAIISVLENTDSIYFIYITEDLTAITDWSIYSFKSLNYK